MEWPPTACSLLIGGRILGPARTCGQAVVFVTLGVVLGGSPLDSHTPSARQFSFDEAQRLLPRVRELTAPVFEEVEALSHELETSGGADQELRERIEAALATWVRDVTATGAEVKGLWLVDFDNGSGYYCWRWPEPRLEYFHSYADGVSGRMRIQ